MVPEAEEVPLSPNGSSSHQAAEPVPAPKPATAAGRSGPGGVETVHEPRLDFLFRSRATQAGQPESFDALWPKRSARQREGQPQVEETPNPAAETPTATEAPPGEENSAVPVTTAAPIDEIPSVAILKSGVVDGMPYTLYADGSIEAQLPQGTVRFGSITELRAHIESNS
jgi:hypothetical protein